MDKNKEKEFTDKLQALLVEYKANLIPQMGIQVQFATDEVVEEKKEETKEEDAVVDPTVAPEPDVEQETLS